jgi:hypothetical protein
MSESADYDPGHWTGHDFTSARAVYDTHVSRSYGDAKAKKVKASDLVPVSIKTNSSAPLVILCDITGSMGDWPATIFSKLPYLELEGQEYLGKEMEISFGAVGDAVSGDDYPLQARKFIKGTALKDELGKLVIEKGGGGGARETYELAALYYARNVSMPKAIRPICIIIGDEGFYDTIGKDDARVFAKTNIDNRMRSKDVFEELMRKYSVYLVRKHYGENPEDGKMSGQNKTIHTQWEDMLGSDRVVILPEAERVVDVIFGILAKETNRIGYFEEELNERQSPKQVKTVMKSLRTVHTGLSAAAAPSSKLLGSGKSVMYDGSIGGKKSKSLL